MADNFGFLDYIDDGTGPALKDVPKKTPDSDSDTGSAERQDFWDNDITHGNDGEGSPNSSVNSSPTVPSHRGFPTPNIGYAKQDGRKTMLDGLRNAKQYGFRKNVERRVFRGSGAMDHDESGNYDPNEEAVAKRRPSKKKATVKPGLAEVVALPPPGLAEVGVVQYDPQDEEIPPLIEEDVPTRESSVDPKGGKESKKKTTTTAGRKKGKGKEKGKAKQ